MRIRRRTYFVDKDVQGALVIRVITYWAASLWGIFCVMAGLPILVTWWFAFPNAPTPAEQVHQTWLDFWPAITASLFLLPFITRDVVRMSNRFVGPFFRMRTALKDLAQGKTIRPISFRRDDFWREIAEDVNQIATLVAARNDQDTAQGDAAQGEAVPTADPTSKEPPAEAVEKQPEELVEV